MPSPHTRLQERGKPGMANALTPEELNILCDYIEVDGTRAHITKQLDHALYERIKLAFERLGGIYTPGRKCFTFDLDPVPLLRQMIVLRQIPEKNPLDFFASTPSVIEALFAELEWGNTMTDLLWDYEHSGRPIHVLEPSAGLGAIADAFRVRYPMASIEVCELDPYRRAVLQAKGYTVVAEDFLEYHPPPEHRYDVILGNPPFTVSGDTSTFLKHISHAETMLSDSPWSKLVTVAPAQFSEQERYHAFHIHVLQFGDYEALPSGSFVESGTKCETAVISLSRRMNAFYAEWDVADPEDGYPNRRLKEAWMYISVDETLSKAHSLLVCDIVEGTLVVYEQDIPSPETRARIHAFCEQVSQRLLREYRLYIPFSQDDESCMVEHILGDYHVAREHYAEMKCMEWQYAQQRMRDDVQKRITKTHARIQQYREFLVTYEAQLNDYTRQLQQLEESLTTPPVFTPAVQPLCPENLRSGFSQSGVGSAVSSPQQEEHTKDGLRVLSRQLAFF